MGLFDDFKKCFAELDKNIDIFIKENNDNIDARYNDFIDQDLLNDLYNGDSKYFLHINKDGVDQNITEEDLYNFIRDKYINLISQQIKDKDNKSISEKEFNDNITYINNKIKEIFNGYKDIQRYRKTGLELGDYKTPSKEVSYEESDPYKNSKLDTTINKQVDNYISKFIKTISEFNNKNKLRNPSVLEKYLRDLFEGYFSEVDSSYSGIKRLVPADVFDKYFSYWKDNIINEIINPILNSENISESELSSFEDKFKEINKNTFYPILKKSLINFAVDVSEYKGLQESGRNLLNFGIKQDTSSQYNNFVTSMMDKIKSIVSFGLKLDNLELAVNSDTDPLIKEIDNIISSNQETLKEADSKIEFPNELKNYLNIMINSLFNPVIRIFNKLDSIIKLNLNLKIDMVDSEGNPIVLPNVISGKSDTLSSNINTILYNTQELKNINYNFKKLANMRDKILVTKKDLLDIKQNYINAIDDMQRNLMYIKELYRILSKDYDNTDPDNINRVYNLNTLF